MKDKREPKLKKVGCYFLKHDKHGFILFKGKATHTIEDGTILIYNKGILWKLQTFKMEETK